MSATSPPSSRPTSPKASPPPTSISPAARSWIDLTAPFDLTPPPAGGLPLLAGEGLGHSNAGVERGDERHTHSTLATNSRLVLPPLLAGAGVPPQRRGWGLPHHHATLS